MDYTPLNRHEKYLNAIMNGDNDNLPKPENREEAYLYNIAMNSGGGGGDDDSVKYTAQTLTTAQQAQARENISAAASDDIPTDAVKYTAQTLTDAQKTQARTNIGVVQPNWDQYNSSEKDYIKNKPPIRAVYPGTNGSFMGGTGMSNMNEATRQNSIAYGYGVSAKGNYSAAFGYFLQALHDYEIALGKFNQSNADTAFSIGDGTSNSDKHNLMELKTDGRMFLNGNAVKTEDAADNKLRLGQICAVVDEKSFKQGFAQVFGTSTALAYITFSTNDFSSSLTYEKLYCFGDFVGYRASNITSMSIYPLAARTAGKTKTGAWICAENCFSMFYSCTSVKSLDLSMFDTSKVKDMRFMFHSCPALATLDISSFDMTNVIAYDRMFGEVNYWAGITTLKCPKINPHDDIPLPRTLYSQDGTAYTTLPVTTGTSIELRASWT